MVNIQVYEKDSNKKIASVRCEENETMTNIQKLEDKYGETQETLIEKDDSKKTPMIRYYLSTENGYTIIVSMSLYQAERVNDYLATYEAFAEVVGDEEMKKMNATEEKHRFYRINQYRPSKKDHYKRVKISQWSQRCSEEGVEWTLGNIRYEGRILNDEITEMSVLTHEDIIEGKSIISAIFFKCSDPRYDWDNGYYSFMVYYRPSKMNWKQTYNEGKLEGHEELLKFVEVALKYFEKEGLNVNVEVVGDDCESKGIESLIPQSSPSDETTETGEDDMTENNGYDRDIVLMEKGEFECGGRTFTYEGKTIFVADVLDHKLQSIDFDIADGEDYNGHLGILPTGQIYCMVTTYMEDIRYLLSYESIIYAPVFSEIYPTASDFVESRIELLQRFQPTKKFQEKVDHCTYKGRFFKDLVKMSADELEAIDNSSAEFSTDDVQAYLDFLLAEAQDPKTWMEGVDIDAELIDYHIRNQINWGINYSEKYCSPSLVFFRMAESMYADIREI